jgi:hypothetical protein
LLGAASSHSGVSRQPAPKHSDAQTGDFGFLHPIPLIPDWSGV